MTRCRSHRTIPAAVLTTLALLALPGTALATGSTEGPQILKINASTGQQTLISSGGNLSTPSGIGVIGGNLLVATGIGAPGEFVGLLSVSQATGAQTVLSQGGSFVSPVGVVAAGATTRVMNGGNVLNVANATGLQTILSQGGAWATFPASWADNNGANTIAVAGSSSCYGAGNGGAGIVNVNTTTGAQTPINVPSLSPCFGLGGIARESGGTLILALTNFDTDNVNPSGGTILRVNPANGQMDTVSTGLNLVSPIGVDLEANGNIVVADSQTGIVRVNRNTGAQTVISSGGLLDGAQGIARSGGSLFVTELGPGPKSSISGSRRQNVARQRAVRFKIRCEVACGTQILGTITGAGRKIKLNSNNAVGGLIAAGQRKSFKLKLSSSQRRRIRRARRRGRTVKAKITNIATDPRTYQDGRRASRTFRLR